VARNRRLYGGLVVHVGVAVVPVVLGLVGESGSGKTTVVLALLGLPLLGDYLEEGLSQFGRSCSDESDTR